MSNNDKPFFISQNSGLGQIKPEDDLLHPVQNAKVSADSLTETQYFGFCVPEQRLHGYAYLWHHPNLHIVGGGLFVWRGHKRTATHSELCDYRDYMSDKVLANDLHEYTLDNGYSVKIIEPLKHHRMRYSDPKRQNSVELDFKAASPPVMFGDGNHFEQAMKVTGELVLRGERHTVDCFTLRDRSWGKPRPEDNLPIPSPSWMQGVFSDDFSFSCNLMDQATNSRELAGTALAVPDDKTLMGGWIYRHGKVGRLVKAEKHIVRLDEDRMPYAVELLITDEFDRTLHLRGQAIASNAWQPWSNLFMPIVLMRWECEGMIAHGDLQEGLWNDYLNLAAR